MTRFVATRLAQAIVIVFGISIVVFSLIRLTGDPLNAMVPQDAPPEEFERVSEYLGLDKPITTQYVRWIRGVLQGDFGRAFFAGRAPALDIVIGRLPATLIISGLALLVAVAVAIPAAMVAAVRPGSWIDNVVSGTIVGFQAMPSFWFGIMLIIVFSVKLELLPVAGRGGVSHLVLPVTTLSIHLVPVVMRVTRARLSTILHEDYVRTARAKGLSERRVLFHHALRNAGSAIVTVVGTRFAYLVAGAVAVEVVFNWPGVGSLLVNSVNNSDFPVVQAAVFVIALGTVLANLATDLLVVAVDPRIRKGL